MKSMVENETVGLLKDTEVGPNYGSEEGGTTKVPQGSTLIEPVMFLFMVAKHLSDSVVTNLLEYRTCKLQLGLSDSSCMEPISTFVENLVQPTTAHVIMSRAIIDAFIPSCLSIFIGPWSDNNGRKFFLIVALSGTMVTYVCWGCMALLPRLPPQAFLLPSIPFVLTGGTSAMYLLIYCYVSDVTDERSRPLRMSFLVIANFASSLFGTAFAPVLVAVQNTVNPYPLIFFLSAFLLLINIIYTCWWIQESVSIKPKRDKRLFQFSNVRSLYATCFKHRDGGARTMSLLIAFALTINVFLVSGEGSIMYLSTREMFSWQLSDFAIYNCFNCIVQGSGCLCGVWLLSSVLGLPNMTATMLLLSTLLSRSLILARAHSGLHFYLSTVIGTFAAAYVPLCRTELSRLVPKQDLGKIFAVTAFLESLSPMVAAPLYTYIYRATFLENPCTVYWLSVILSAICLSMIVVVAIKQRTVKGACYMLENLKESDSMNTSACCESIDE